MEVSPTIFIVPTGIGCEIGGFAGDALPTAKLLASASGCLITHPNVMNGGVLSEKDNNIFYVEGYSLDRFAKGEIGLRSVKKQKIGIIFDSAIEHELLVRHLQVADACVATLGIDVDSYAVTKNPLGIVIDSDLSKISGGVIENPEALIEAGKYLIQKGITAIAIVAKFPEDLNCQKTNFYREGKGIDPISGVEAVISHLVSKYLKVPCAHAPALDLIEFSERVDPRAAAEEIGYTFLPSVLIGLSNAPNLVELPNKNELITLHPNQLENIVVPDGALGGEAVLASAERGLNIISVKNDNSLKVNNQFLNYPNLIEVSNYLEAAGLILSIKKGINLNSIQRPLRSAKKISLKD
ncbi:DUF3326 domain-containing protein [Prochlorococcus sp. AH-736-K09]|nr:DUF3326 domain-containing protein [Prochlorococcus sp. AH-736-K09]